MGGLEQRGILKFYIKLDKSACETSRRITRSHVWKDQRFKGNLCDFKMAKKMLRTIYVLVATNRVE